MTRRYALLLAAVVAAAVAVSVMARRPHSAVAHPPAAAALPVTDLALVYRAGRLTPEASATPKNTDVRLVIENASDAPLAIALGGYEGRLTIPEIAPGATWSGRFVADQPGEGFPWLAGGRPVGRLIVTGSHLEEGHR